MMDQDTDQGFPPPEEIEGKECPVCDGEYRGACPANSSDCPFVYEDDLVAEKEILKGTDDFELDDDLVADEEDDVSIDSFEEEE